MGTPKSIGLLKMLLRPSPADHPKSTLPLQSLSSTSSNVLRLPSVKDGVALAFQSLFFPLIFGVC
jgi:hypothetical protein